MRVRKGILYIGLLMALPFPSLAQDYTVKANDFFRKYTDSKALLELALKALPTMEDCKMVFKEKNAYTYFGFVEDMKKKMQEEATKPGETFKAVRVTANTSCDLERGQGDFPGGMTKCIGSFHSNVTFYAVTLLPEEGATAGVTYSYWIRIDGRWVYFPKPWRVGGT